MIILSSMVDEIFSKNINMKNKNVIYTEYIDDFCEENIYESNERLLEFKKVAANN